MAHECPECGQTCYCGGDIDDCYIPDSFEEFWCRHCPLDGVEEEDDQDYESWLEYQDDLEAKEKEPTDG